MCTHTLDPSLRVVPGTGMNAKCFLFKENVFSLSIQVIPSYYCKGEESALAWPLLEGSESMTLI